MSAKNVEVIIGNLENEKHVKIDMPQDNLLWSSHEKGSITGSTYDEMKERMYWPYISPGKNQFCNLGFVKKPTKENIHTKFELQVYWPSPNSLHILKHGYFASTLQSDARTGKQLQIDIVCGYSRTYLFGIRRVTNRNIWRSLKSKT
ncbi:MAG: hypothetical protein IPL67_12290 [Ignavibacteria bacterium]|nr:hypothetical protein [Ignavibacteria bacterium]